jgi:hypothetical protein
VLLLLLLDWKAWALFGRRQTAPSEPVHCAVMRATPPALVLMQ